MQRYSNNVQRDDGRAIIGAIVTVTNYPSGTPATLYAAEGGSPIAHVLTTDATGEYAFYAPNGRYRLTINALGYPQDELIETLFDPDDFAAAFTLVLLAQVALTKNVFTKAQVIDEVTLTDAATVAIDATASNNFQLTLGGDRTIANPTGMVKGQVVNIVLKQDATGNRLATWGSKWDFGLAGVPVLSTGANKIDFVSAYYNGTADRLLATFRKSA